MKSEVYKTLSDEVKAVLLLTEGWLVGNSIVNIGDGFPVKDYDIIVPSREKFQDMVKLQSVISECNINSYGGLKVKTKGGVSLDVWCEELSHFLSNANEVTYIYNYKKNILLRNIT